MIRLSRPTASNTASSLSTTNASSFDLEYNYLSSPPLAHAKEGSATRIPFHLPPTPPSPMTGYKQRMERQIYCGQCSLAPPSPSTRSILSPPPITERLSAPSRESDNKLLGVLEFDSYNIQYTLPLNPFMTPPTGLLWNDPKLSPIHGSIITYSPNIDGGLSTPERSWFARHASTLSRHFSKAALSSSPGSSRPGPGIEVQNRERELPLKVSARRDCIDSIRWIKSWVSIFEYGLIITQAL